MLITLPTSFNILNSFEVHEDYLCIAFFHLIFQSDIVHSVSEELSSCYFKLQEEGILIKRSLEFQTPNSEFPQYGVPKEDVDSFPNYYERALLVWYNMVRMAPQSFKVKWMKPVTDSSISNVFNSSRYNNTDSILWNLNLNKAARAHSVDRSTCASNAGGSAHNDCNGTDASVRVSKFYPNFEGEIFWDYPAWTFGGNASDLIWPFFAVSGWICDGALYSNGMFKNCVADGTGDGHRMIIMQIGKEIGCGTEFVKNRVTTTCDVGSERFYSGRKIASGAHIFDPFLSNSYRYLANYNDPTGGSLDNAQVIVDGLAISLTLESGSPNSGTYQSAVYPIGNGCKSYYFEFSTNGTTERYPESGLFLTFGELNCSQDFTTETETFIFFIDRLPPLPSVSVTSASLQDVHFCLLEMLIIIGSLWLL